MSATEVHSTQLSANDQFKAQYPKYIRWSAVVATILFLVAIRGRRAMQARTMIH